MEMKKKDESIEMKNKYFVKFNFDYINFNNKSEADKAINDALKEQNDTRGRLAYDRQRQADFLDENKMFFAGRVYSINEILYDKLKKLTVKTFNPMRVGYYWKEDCRKRIEVRYILDCDENGNVIDAHLPENRDMSNKNPLPTTVMPRAKLIDTNLSKAEYA